MRLWGLGRSLHKEERVRASQTVMGKYSSRQCSRVGGGQQEELGLGFPAGGDGKSGKDPQWSRRIPLPSVWRRDLAKASS